MFCFEAVFETSAGGNMPVHVTVLYGEGAAGPPLYNGQRPPQFPGKRYLPGLPRLYLDFYGKRPGPF